ncbi:flagellar basal body-associated FliL family protein [Demequina sp.]|uniref:flagellar basal body-associated FliL family protein n=1 Tax=Demequina sp. TaxID=2050685 RepID=UPI003A8451B9
MTDSRVVAPQTKIGVRPTAATAPPVAEQAPAPARGGSRRWSVVVGVIIVALACGGYWFLAGPGAAASDSAATEQAPALGDVQLVESISINLADGHYLRLGLGLQLSAEASGHGDLDVAKALDAAISLFTGRTVQELADPATREELKGDLIATLGDAYHGEVLGVYYTDFVTQ